MEKVNKNSAYCTVAEGGERMHFVKSQAPIEDGNFLMKFVIVLSIKTYQ